MSRTTSPLTLAALAAATLTASLGVSIASVLLPELAARFAVTVGQVRWVVLAYLMAMTVAVVVAGRLGDLFGRRRVLNAGLLLFGAASILCAAAPGFAGLVVGRGLQGLGGAILIALPMSMARDAVPAGRLGTAMGLLGTTSALGTALGPTLGGALLDLAGWRPAFWMLAGFAAVTLAISHLAIGAEPRRHGTGCGALDLPGMLSLGVCLMAFALLTGGGAGPVPMPVPVLALVTVAAAGLFAVIERRVASPLVPLGLLVRRGIGDGLMLNVIVGAIMMSTLVVGPFFLAHALALSPARAGLVLAVGPVVAALSGLPAGRLTDRMGAPRTRLLGLGQTVFGLAALAVLPRLFGTWGYVAALGLLTPAFQLFLAANNTLVLAGAAEAERGRLSGLLGLSRNLGLMTGASAMPVLYAALLGGAAGQGDAAAVGRAFSATFAAAAGLALAALVLAAGAGRAPRPAPLARG